MSDYDPRQCPSAEVLGGFVQGNLASEAQKQVAQHLVSCADCVFVVSETSRYLASDNDESSEDEGDAPASGRRWLGVAAIAAALASLLGIWYVRRTPDGLQQLRRAAARAETRSEEGRLIGFPYRRYAAVRSDAVLSDIESMEAKRTLAKNVTSADGWRSRGVAALILGDRKAAVVLLERAVRMAPQEATYWNDLSVAYLASGRMGLALGAADRAISLAPSLEEARFNRAIAFDHLGLRRSAASAYEAYLRADPRSRWSYEVRKNRRFLSFSPPSR